MAIESVLKKMIGKSSDPITIEVEKGQIRRFAKAIGETNPIHFDEEAAQKCGYPTIIATPTFPSGLHDYEVLYESLSLNAHAIMHAEEQYEYFKPIFAGDKLTVVHTVSNAYDKETPNGRLVWIVIETNGIDTRTKKKVFKARRSLVELKK